MAPLMVGPPGCGRATAAAAAAAALGIHLVPISCHELRGGGDAGAAARGAAAALEAAAAAAARFAPCVLLLRHLDVLAGGNGGCLPV